MKLPIVVNDKFPPDVIVMTPPRRDEESDEQYQRRCVFVHFGPAPKATAEPREEA